MKIAVVGAGAIGGLFGSILTKGGLDVTLVDIWEESVKVMQTTGLTVVGQAGKEEVVKVKATTKIDEVGTPDLIMIAVKSYDTAQAARDCLKIVGADTMVFTVQNGVGNVDTIGDILGRNRIVAGTTSFGCTRLGPGKIKPSGIGEITIGELDGKITPRLQNLVDTFIKAGIEMHTSQNVDSLIWSKLVVNVGINALTAITMLKNGELLDYAETRSLQEAVVKEATAVAAAKNIKFLVDDPLAWVQEVARNTRDNKSSMRQDVERGSKTEVDFINGTIVREGLKLGIPTPVNDTLTKLIKTIEHRGKI